MKLTFLGAAETVTGTSVLAIVEQLEVVKENTEEVGAEPQLL